jgi:hypothetical protein
MNKIKFCLTREAVLLFIMNFPIDIIQRDQLFALDIIEQGTSVPMGTTYSLQWLIDIKESKVLKHKHKQSLIRMITQVFKNNDEKILKPILNTLATDIEYPPELGVLIIKEIYDQHLIKRIKLGKSFSMDRGLAYSWNWAKDRIIENLCNSYKLDPNSLLEGYINKEIRY